MFTIFMVVSFGEPSSPVGSGCMVLVVEGWGRTAYSWDRSTWGDTLLRHRGEMYTCWESPRLHRKGSTFPIYRAP